MSCVELVKTVLKIQLPYTPFCPDYTLDITKTKTVASKWVDEPNFSEQISLMTLDFLRSNKRVVSVKYYAAPFRYVDGMLSQSHIFMEINNPSSRFFPGHNWELLTRWKAPRDYWNTMPPNWTRIAFFPFEKPPTPS